MGRDSPRGLTFPRLPLRDVSSVRLGKDPSGCMYSKISSSTIHYGFLMASNRRRWMIQTEKEFVERMPGSTQNGLKDWGSRDGPQGCWEPGPLQRCHPPLKDPCGCGHHGTGPASGGRTALPLCHSPWNELSVSHVPIQKPELPSLVLLSTSQLPRLLSQTSWSRRSRGDGHFSQIPTVCCCWSKEPL